MMMRSTMILTICISMVLKRNRRLSLDIGSHYYIICTLCWFCWIGSGGGEAYPPFDPQTKKFSHQCGGHFQPVGVKPPTSRQIEHGVLAIKYTMITIIIIIDGSTTGSAPWRMSLK